MDVANGLVAQAQSLREILELNQTCTTGSASHWKSLPILKRGTLENAITGYLKGMALPMGPEDRATACGRALLPTVLGGVVCCGGKCFRDIGSRTGLPSGRNSMNTVATKGLGTELQSLPAACTSSGGFAGAEAAASFVIGTSNYSLLAQLASPEMPTDLPAVDLDDYQSRCMPAPSGYDILTSDGIALAARGPARTGFQLANKTSPHEMLPGSSKQDRAYG